MFALTVASTAAEAQLQRRIAGPGGGGVELPNIPANPRYPMRESLMQMYRTRIAPTVEKMRPAG